jgi:WhiB family redox-sensing transcriptional regulator
MDEWMGDALCRDVDPEVFFPWAEGGALLEFQEAEAKEVCRLCPVASECLATHMAEPWGVFGGMTAGERKAARFRQGV